MNCRARIGDGAVLPKLFGVVGFMLALHAVR